MSDWLFPDDPTVFTPGMMLLMMLVSTGIVLLYGTIKKRKDKEWWSDHPKEMGFVAFVGTISAIGLLMQVLMVLFQPYP